MFSQISDRTRECESILGRPPIKGRDGIAADKEALLNSKYNEANATCEKVSDKKRRGAPRPRTRVSCRSDVPVRCTVLAHLHYEEAFESAAAEIHCWEEARDRQSQPAPRAFEWPLHAEPRWEGSVSNTMGEIPEAVGLSVFLSCHRCRSAPSSAATYL